MMEIEIAIIQKAKIRVDGFFCGVKPNCKYLHIIGDYIYCKLFSMQNELECQKNTDRILRDRACLGCEARAKGLGWYNEKNIRYNHECKR
jgi:hypothetical protein